MKKITLKILTLLLVLMALRPSVTQAQSPFCPMGIWNDSHRIGLTNQNVYNTFIPGIYYVTVLSDQVPGCPVINLPVSITKVDNMNSVFPNTSTGAGIIMDFPQSFCNYNGIDVDPFAIIVNNTVTTVSLQTGSTSIVVATDPSADPFLVVNYTNNVPDDCIYTVIPVTFGTFNVHQTTTGPLRNLLEWTTLSEQNINHFSIQKSLNGRDFYKIGQVTAAGNSNAIQNYSFYDNYPTSDAYYRIVSVDIDCKWQYTIIVRLTCSGCPITDGNTILPADCSVPPVTPVISGPSSICNNARTLYRLNNLKGEAKVTWSISPSNLATIAQASRMVSITPANIAGVGTLTATVVVNGTTTTYDKTITFGISPIYAAGSITPAPCGGPGTFTATVSMLPGTHPYEYSWYQGGTWIGSGQSHTWSINQGQVIYYEVRYNGPCGQSVYYGSSDGSELPKTAPSPKYSISPNPAHGMISIAKPICPARPRLATGDTRIIVKIYDMQGNLRKTKKVDATASRIEISTEGLQPGLYYVQISEPGKEDTKLKVWVDK
jgi:hypothetical protein